MYRFFLAAVDVIPAAVVLIPVFIVLYFKRFDHNLQKCTLYCVFCLYLSAMFVLVGIPNVSYFRPEVNLNLIPLKGMVQDLKNGILNVILFVPLGFLLPILWKRFRSLGPCTFFGLSLSLVVELLQMLTFRATDVNDLITNTTGTFLGFLLAKGLTAKIPPAGEGRSDAVRLTVLSFCVMFFVHPFLSPLIWDRIL